MRKRSASLTVAITAASASVIGVQVGFMRALSVVQDFHFSYFVISMALLGFGASGTALAVASRHWRSRNHRAPQSLILRTYVAFVALVPIALHTAIRIPIDFQYLVYDFDQVGRLVLFAFFAFLPFLSGGLVIGSILSRYGAFGDLFYGSNLIGSGLGALGVLGLMVLVPPTGLFGVVHLVSAFGLVALLWAGIGRGRRRLVTIGVALIAVLLSVVGAVRTPEVAVDQHKALSRLSVLEQQDQAERVYFDFSPQGRIDVFESRTFHYSPFASPIPEARPPEQLTLLLDGSVAGSILRIDSAGQTRMFEALPQSLAYRLNAPERVLLLGETGGMAVWLARYYGARRITVVHPNRALLSTLQHELADAAGNVYDGVEIVAGDPRLYVESTEERFDVVHVVSAETLPGAGSGLHSLRENYLMTVRGMQAMLQVLTPSGFLSVTRGTQTPPRDNIKIFATAARALRDSRRDPGKALLQARNYLAATTLVSAADISAATAERFRHLAETLTMDVEFAPHLDAPTGQRNQIEGPADKPYSYYYAANQAIVGSRAEEFFDSWVYRLEPATDERPYFENFFRWSTLPEFRSTYGRAWVRRLELGYLVLAATALVCLVLAVAMIGGPLVFRSRDKTRRQAAVTLPQVIAYFATIGLGFMFVEIVAIQTFSQALGNHVYSATAVLSGMLVFSGLGSITQSRVHRSDSGRIVRGAVVACALLVAFIAVRRFVITSVAALGIAGRFSVVLMLLLPVAYLLGWFFSSGLRVVSRSAPELIPWAWASNGFASVLASPLALLLAMEIGHSAVLSIGAALYLSLAVYGVRWCRRIERTPASLA